MAQPQSHKHQRQLARRRSALPSAMRPGALACAAHIALFGAVFAAATAHPNGAWAQAASATAATQSYAIPAGALDSVLARFLTQSGALLSGDTELTQGKRSPGLNGNYTVDAGLDELLQGTGLQAVRQSGGSYMLYRASASLVASRSGNDARILPEVIITAVSLNEATTEGTGRYVGGASGTAAGLALTQNETPQSITLVTRQRIDDQGLDRISAVVDQVPGLHTDQTGSDGAQVSPIYARGFRLDNFQVDGIGIPANALQDTGGSVSGVGMMDTAIYDHIVVVRGATGLMTGEGNPSGAINFVRKHPTREFQAHLQGGTGRWGRYRVVGDFSGSLNLADSLRGRLVLAHDKRNDSWLQRHDGGSRQTLYGVLEADLSATDTLRAGVERAQYKDDGAPSWGYPIADTAGRPRHFDRGANVANQGDYVDSRRTMVFADLEHGFANGWIGKLSLNRSLLDYAQDTSVFYGDVDADTNAGLLWTWRNRNTARQDGANLRLEGDYGLLGRVHTFFAELNYQELQRDDPSYLFEWLPVADVDAYDGRVPKPELQLMGRMTETVRRTGVTASTRFVLADDLALVSGLRLGHYQRRSMTAGFGQSARERGMLTPYLGLVKNWGEDWSTYASYTAIHNPQTYRNRDGAYLVPEKGESYELGLRRRWFGGALEGSAMVFSTRKQNLAVAEAGVLTPNGEQAYVAVDNARSRGYELEINGALQPSWNLFAGYARTFTREAGGARLNRNLPASQFKLFTTYRPIGPLTVGGGVAWHARMDNQTHPVGQGSYAVASFMLRYALGERFTAQLDLGNAFDRHYLTTVDFRNYGEPRNWLLSLRYDF